MALCKFHIPRDELADRLGKGIPKGSLVVLEGEQGAGKSVLVGRLAHGFLENGLALTLVSTQHTTNHFIEQMASLGYPVDDAMLEGKLLFLPVYPLLAFQRPKEDILDRLLGASTMFERDVVVVDALSTLLHSYSKATGGRELLARIEHLLYFLKIVCARGTTVILTLETEDLPPDATLPLRNAADVYMSLRIALTGMGVGRSILVRRFERAEHPVADLIAFRVEPKAGLIVEIKNVS